MNRLGTPLLFFAAIFACVSSAAGLALAQGANDGYLPPQSGPGPYYGPPPGDGAPRSLAPPPPGTYNGGPYNGAPYNGNGGAYNGGPYDNPGYGQPYSEPPPSAYRDGPPPPPDAYPGPPPQPGTYTSYEILDAGHHFFGTVSEGLGRVVEYAFRKYGRPNGYILGEEAAGAVVAGLRYGEGMLYTKNYGTSKIYWQGPSVGYDFGANGSKTLTLIYNLQFPQQLYERFAGIDGSAYFVGGAGITFQQHDDVILAPIRAGVGLRLGANVGYLKYTPSPTWNPF
jgi:hypothetical protein